MGASNTRHAGGCAIDPDSKFETWGGVIWFQRSCVLNAIVLNSVYSALVVWITTASSHDLDASISRRIPRNKNGQRAAVWGATLAVAFASAFTIYMLLHLIFGYGNVNTNLPTSDVKILKVLVADYRRDHPPPKDADQP